MAKATASDPPWPEHPLFPADEGETPKRVEYIQVMRHENGRCQQIPRVFRANELTTLEDIFNLWGGGVYEIWGRQASIHNPEAHGKITANRRYEIAGLSKPLSVDGSHVVAPAQAAVAPTTGVASPDTSVMGMFMQMQMAMMQAAQENARQTAETQRQASERSRQETLQSQQMMMQMQTTMMSSMMGVVTAVVSSKGGGGGVDEIAKMAGLLKDLGVVGPKGGGDEGEGTESIGSIIGNVADIVAGAVELKQGAQTNGGPPGSAASALGLPTIRAPGEA